MSKHDGPNIEALLATRDGLSRWVAGLGADIGRVADGIISTLRSGGTVYACGNGGSATQATHFAAELVGRFRRNRHALPAISLSDNTATLTALANDYAYDDVFAHQIRGVAKPPDCLLALSTSGNSENVVRACRDARAQGISVFALTGNGGGAVAEHCDVNIMIEQADTALIQEAHLIVIHILCEVVEGTLFSRDDLAPAEERREDSLPDEVHVKRPE